VPLCLTDASACSAWPLQYGPESSGKTTLALHAIAEVQKQGGVATFIDVEHALDTEYAAARGVDMDELYISQPQSGEQALEIMVRGCARPRALLCSKQPPLTLAIVRGGGQDTLVRSASMDLVVLDSVAALVPRAELEGEMGDVHVGLQARLMSQALRKLTASLSAGPLNQVLTPARVASHGVCVVSDCVDGACSREGGGWTTDRMRT
jgi:recombination protein RecA